MGVIPSCLGIVLFLGVFFSLPSPIQAVGYTDAFFRASVTTPEILQAEPAVQGIAAQRKQMQNGKWKVENEATNQQETQQQIPNTKKLTTQNIPSIPNTPTPTIKKPLPVGENNSGTIIAGINAYRQSKGLSAVATDQHTCAFARTRAGEIAGNFSHDGFTQRIQNKTIPYPSYSKITENIAQTKDPQKVVSLWINSPSHAKNMEADTPYVCVESSGTYYAYEGWKP